MIRIRKKLVWFLVFFLAVLTGVGLAFLYQRTWIAQMAIDRVLRGSGLAQARISVERIGLRSAAFSGIVLAGDFWSVDVDSLGIDYDWRRRRILLVESGPARMRVDVDAALEAPSERSLDEFADQIEAIREALPEIPFSLGAIEITIRYRQTEETLRMEGKGHLGAEPLIEGQFSLGGQLGDGEIDLSRPDRSGPLVIQGSWATRGDPLDPIGRLFPDWADLLPASFGNPDPSVGPVQVRFRLEQDRLRIVSIDLETTVTEVGLTSQGRLLSLGELRSHLNWKVREDPVLSLELSELAVNSGEFRASADRISARAVVGRRLEIEVPEVEIDSNGASGRMGLRFGAPWPTGDAIPMGATMEADVHSLRAGGLECEPFRIGVRTESDEVVVDLPRLATDDAAWPVLNDLILRTTLESGGIDALTGKGRVAFGGEPGGDSPPW